MVTFLGNSQQQYQLKQLQAAESQVQNWDAQLRERTGDCDRGTNQSTGDLRDQRGCWSRGFDGSAHHHHGTQSKV